MSDNENMVLTFPGSAEGARDYDRDYFQNGVATGKSCYSGYRWIPEFSIPWAARLMRRLDIKPGQPVLDYGCAYGFTVRALRLLGVQAFGCDLSIEATLNTPTDVADFIEQSYGPSIPFQAGYHFDWILAKDVLEHLTPHDLDVFLTGAKQHTDNLFVVVPLGNGKRYNVLAYEHDVTHKIRESHAWWLGAFADHGWTTVNSTLDMRGLKDTWAHFPDGNAAFTLRATK